MGRFMELKPPRVQFYEQALTGGELAKYQLHECHVAGFRLTESACPAGFKLPKHSHEHASFCLVLQGRLTETYSNKSFHCKPSTMVFTPPDQAHSDDFHIAERTFILEITPAALKRIREYSAIPNDSTTFCGGWLGSLMRRLYAEFRHLDEVSPLVMEGLALEIMSELSRNSMKDSAQKSPVWLEHARNVIHSRFSECLTLAGVAESVDVHPVHLASVFRRFYRCSVGEYIRRLRIESACEEIARSDTPLTQIALDAGFSDQSHFSKTFKHLMGMTPSQYRSILRPRLK